MKINEFKKLEKKINGYNFNENYKSINKIMISISYFGHIASIFLAFFFMSKILSSAIINNPIVVFISSFIILAGLELLKRDIFDKFSIQSLKDKGISKSVMPLMIASLLLISGSFYSSINGAKEFSYKSDQIEEKADENIQDYVDSMKLVYEPKILGFEQQNIELFEANKLLDEEARALPSTWISNKNKIRSRIDVNNDQIDKNDNKISLLKEEMNSKIDKYKSELSTDTNKEKEENSKNSFIFVMISTLIELVILGGVYFSEYYKFRSYKEFRQKIEKDPNYKKWLLYDEIISIIFTDDIKINQKLPSSKSIIEMCKVHDLIVLPRDLTSFMKVLHSLDIIRSSGSAKYFNKTKEVAQDILRKKFNIE